MEMNLVNWFEIPVVDMPRAMQFYEEVLSIELHREQMGPLDMAWFPWKEGAPGSAGSLVKNDEHYQPSASSGVVIYFSVDDVASALEKVTVAGGSVQQEKTLITKEIGYMGLALDSEGNRIAFHSRT